MNNASAFFLPVYRGRRMGQDGGMRNTPTASPMPPAPDAPLAGPVGARLAARLVVPLALALAVASMALLAPGRARAQPVQGLYMSGGVGLSFQAPYTHDSLPPIDPPPATRSVAPAPTPAPLPTGQAALGYGFAGSGLPMRVELQGAFMNGRASP